MKNKIKKTSAYRHFFDLQKSLDSYLVKLDLLIKNKDYSTYESEHKKFELLLKERDQLGHKLVSQTSWFALISTSVQTLAVVAILYTNYQSLIGIATHIDMSYYSTIVGFIPVFLIAIYVGNNDDEKIDKIKDLISDFIGLIVPSLAGILVSLFSLASHSSNGFIFVVTIYSILVLSLRFIQKISRNAINTYVYDRNTKK